MVDLSSSLCKRLPEVKPQWWKIHQVTSFYGIQTIPKWKADEDSIANI